MFLTIYSKRERIFVSDPGTEVKIKYEVSMKPNGTYVLVESGKENLYEQIQSYRDSCDINKIIARYLAGDESVLNKTSGFYSDVVGLPNNMSEVFNVIRRGQSIFDSLPVEEKEKFGNSFEKWIMDFERCYARPTDDKPDDDDENNDKGEVRDVES